MVTIDEELEAAKAAKAAIETLTMPLSEATIGILRKAYRMATVQTTTIPSEKPLNDARDTVGITLPDLIRGPPTQQRIDKAKGAIEDWINLLEAQR